MSAKSLIERATAGKMDECEASLSRLCYRALSAAIRRAEKINEFTAVANLTDLRDNYDSGQTAAPSSKLDPKDAQAIKITRTDKVSGGVWDAIIAKVKKIGEVSNSDKSSITANVKKAEYAPLVKALQTIAGVTVG